MLVKVARLGDVEAGSQEVVRVDELVEQDLDLASDFGRENDIGVFDHSVLESRSHGRVLARLCRLVSLDRHLLVGRALHLVVELLDVKRA